ncbi:MAG: HipA N-terminal domain-containing protein, partial [Burkholderiales bacterium]
MTLEAEFDLRVNLPAVPNGVGSTLNVLEVRLGAMLAGFLSKAGAVHRFTAAPTYVDMLDRPILSQQFRGACESETRQRLTSERGSHAVALGRLPPFFANLLPEGPLRSRIIGPRAVAPDYEFDLLATVGDDLPGDVT